MKLLLRTTRHLHDIVRLYESLEEKGKVTIDESLFRKLRNHRKQWFGRSVSLFRSSTFRRLCIIPQFYLLGPLMDDYRKLRQGYIFDTKLEFPALIGKIQQINARINGIEWNDQNSGYNDSVLKSA